MDENDSLFQHFICSLFFCSSVPLFICSTVLLTFTHKQARLKKYSNLFLALATGILCWIAWPVSPLTFLIFVAWIPLLWLEEKCTSRKKFFWLTYVAMFIWNVPTTWWIWNASAPGAVAAFFANSLIDVFALAWI